MNILSIIWNWNPTLVMLGDIDIRWYGLMWAEAILAAERICNYTFSIPWFKHFDKEWIERYAAAFRKVVENHQQLLDADAQAAQGGRWYGFDNK